MFEVLSIVHESYLQASVPSRQNANGGPTHRLNRNVIIITPPCDELPIIVTLTDIWAFVGFLCACAVCGEFQQLTLLRSSSPVAKNFGGIPPPSRAACHLL